MPTYNVKFFQYKSLGRINYQYHTSFYFESNVNMEEVTCTAAKYISQFIAMPGYAIFDEIRSSYPIYIEIFFLRNRLTRLFILKETKNEYKSFLKVWDKHYTIIDHETNQSLNISRDMFTEVVSNIIFEQAQHPEIKRKSPEISVPMGGAVKVKKKIR